jgi:hypothetical protein
MRYTSYNMAVTALKARKCLSDFVERMWEYIEDGNIEKTECARNKALMLDALIATVEGYHPTIQDAKVTTITVTTTSGSYPIPFVVDPIFVNGIQITNKFTAYDGTNVDVFKDGSEAINCYLSTTDDVLKATAKMSGESIVITIIHNESLSPIDTLNAESLSGGVTTTTAYSEEEDYEYPRTCLTEDQMRNIVEKIDELCECNC